MKILVLNGSPKKKSDTFRLTEAFLKGLNADGSHTVTIVNAIDQQIAPCRGCFGCWARGDGHCVINDDQNVILDLYRDADVIIWSFPLYCYGMPSHLKAVLDRTIPLVKMKMVQEADGTVRHESLVDFSRIHTVVICGCGFPHWEGNFDGLKQMCKTCFGNLDMVCVPETPLLNVPEASVVADPLLERFEKAGEEYSVTLALSADTVAELEKPMISAEEYIRQVNSQDTFKTGCVYGLLHGMQDEDLVRFANACSAIAISRFPLLLNPLKPEEVQKLIRNGSENHQ